MPRYPYRDLGIKLDRDFRNNLNDNFDDIEADVKDLVTRIDNIVAQSGSDNTEIVDARYDSINKVTYPTLKDRLDDTSDKIGILNQRTSGYRTQTPPSGSGINVIAGYEGNAISQNSKACVIGGGGEQFANNVIGGITSTVGNMTENNVVDDTLTVEYAHIGGGYDNVNNGRASGINTGLHCIIESAADHATISGGSYNKITTGSYGTIGGGSQNEVNAPHATVSGGIRNKTNAEKSTISGGSDNIASGVASVVSGGQTNTASGHWSIVVGGQNNIASGIYAVAYGEGNTASLEHSSAIGRYAKTFNPGQQAYANGKFNKDGDAQTSFYVLRTQTTDGNQKVIGINDTGNSITLTSTMNSVFLINAKVVAMNNTDAKTWEIKATVRKDGNNSVSLIGSVSKTVIAASEGATSWDVNFLVGVSSFAFMAIGEATKTIRWVAKVETIESGI